MIFECYLLQHVQTYITFHLPCDMKLSVVLCIHLCQVCGGLRASPQQGPGAAGSGAQGPAEGRVLHHQLCQEVQA